MKKYNIKVNGSVYEVEVEEVPVRTGPTNVHEAVRAACGPGSDNFGMQGQAQSLNDAPAPADAPAPGPVGGGAEAAASAAAGRSEEGSGRQVITAPMPGKILDVRTATGQSVCKGDILFILEAMKMENEIMSSVDGTVISVAVERGAAVTTGDILAAIALK